MERELWHNIYKHELVEMFNMVVETVKINYPDAVINVDEDFHNFSRLVFEGSSKFMSQYTIATEVQADDNILY